MITKKTLTLALGSFLLGSLPFWGYNLFNKAATLQYFLRQRSIVHQSLFTRWELLKETFQGRGADIWFFNQSLTSESIFGGSLLWPLFWLALIGFCWIGIFDAKRRPYILALLLIVGAMLFQILLVSHVIWPHHCISLYPLPHLLVVLFLYEIKRTLQTRINCRPARMGVLIVPLLALLVTNGMTVYNQQKLIENSGGNNSWTSSIYLLADTLKKEYANRPIQIMDWGVGHQLFLLSSGGLDLNEAFWLHWKHPGIPKEYVRLISDPNNVFILHSPAAVVFPEVDATFYAAVKQARADIKKEREFFEADGRPIYKIIEFSKPRNESNG